MELPTSRYWIYGVGGNRLRSILFLSWLNNHVEHILTLFSNTVSAIGVFRFSLGHNTMQFFQSFFSLGYSGVVLLVTTLFVAALAFNGLKLQNRPVWLRAAFLGIVAVLFVLATNFLAAERKIMMDAIRDEGGLKRTQER